MAVIRNKVAKVISGAPVGFDGALIEVETDMKSGLPGIQVVGMGNKAIDEARQRVRSAITNSLLDFPAQKVTVNLAPAELPKDGTHLDVPIALSILVASGQLKQSEVANTLFAGELALDGSVRSIRGAVILAELARSHTLQRIVVPHQNVPQARLVSSIEVIGVGSLQELYRALRGFTTFTSHSVKAPAMQPQVTLPLFNTIIGQQHAKRALAIAAAGRHNLLLSGPPGTGKTLLARSLIDILPPLNTQEIVEVTKLHSLAHGDEGVVHTSPPFRSPHHSATLTALIGGGLRPRPGDISLAHKGVLFLDELPEYPRILLEALRQPLEDGVISLSRLYGHIRYPADVMLIATMNPCPCGFKGDPTTLCICSAMQLASYQKRISGPLLDRIDLRLTVTKIKHEQFFDTKALNNSQHLEVLKLVLIARKVQQKRYNRSDYYNAYASIKEAKRLSGITAPAKNLLENASKKLNLSSRSALRVLRVARTIADLEQSKNLDEQHVAEALQFR